MQGAGTGREARSGVVEPGGIGSGPAGPEGDAPGGIGPGGAGAQTLVGTAVGVSAGVEPAGADAGVGADTGASGALSGVGAGSAVVAEARTGAGASAGTGSLRSAEAVTSSDGDLSVAHPDTAGVTLVGHAPSTGHAPATGPTSVAGSASGAEPTELTGSADGAEYVGRDGSAGPTGPTGPTGSAGSTELIVGSDRAEPVGRSRAAEGVQPVEVTQPVGADRAAGVGGTATARPSRRLFVSRLVAGTALAAATATVGAGAYGVLNGPKVKRVTVPLAKLPRSAHGFRIAVVSDIHLGPILGRSFAERVVRTINSTQPDLIAIVGDLVDGDVADLGPAAEPLARLRARHGTYFVTGNHEYFSGAEQWVDEVRDLGLHPMENVRTELPGFDLAGVNDLAGEGEGDGPDFERALGGRDTARASVLLAHQPIVIHDAVRHGVDLQLSGHTHGGQLWPVSYLAGLQNPTLAGLERYGDTQLYVTRGAGAWGPPVRVGAESDITVVELASKQA
ncbi:metallophosphoesterase [Streptomyces uncialis]|uniref:metallophosphoesterase n=1 Tax=Streptomyces uncialis TaxID=1048205 RepID=UPI00365CDC3A